MPRSLSVDLDNIIEKMSTKSYKLSDIKDKIEKVAYDVVRFVDGSPEELWQIQNTDDGDYIVALYKEEDKVATASIKNNWLVTVKNANLHVFYKQDHLLKIAASELGFGDADLNMAKRYLPQKLASNKSLVSALLKSVSDDVRTAILAKYPELS